MPSGRRKPTESSEHSPPLLSPQPSVRTRHDRSSDHAATIDDHGNFEQFVRAALADIRQGQIDLNKRIDRMEDTCTCSLNASIEFESKWINDLEQKVKELEKMANIVAQAEHRRANATYRLAEKQDILYLPKKSWCKM